MQTATTFKISQSALKSFFGEGECRLAFKKEFIERLGSRRKGSDALTKGLIFEHHLIGGTRDGKVPHLPLTGIKSLKPPKSAKKEVKVSYLLKKDILARALEGKSSEELDQIIQELPEDLSEGKPGKPETDLINYATNSRHYLEDLGIVADQVQPEVSYQDLIGHLDLQAFVQGEPAIVDIKYTETQADDRWRGWGDPQEMDHLQAVFYVDLMEKATGHRLPFYYLVFGKPKEDGTPSWMKWIQVHVSEEALAAHQLILDNFRTSLEFSSFPACGDFNICQNCAFADTCESATTTPKLEEIEI